MEGVWKDNKERWSNSFKTLISAFTDENDYVLDNTMGVGTTCLGAKELNRKFIGIEKEVKYYDLPKILKAFTEQFPNCV